MTDTKPANTVDKWQKRINRDFPNGLLMAWKGSENSESAPHYRIWKISVVEMEGFDPVVELRVFDVNKTFVGRVESYSKVQDKPLMMEVKFSDLDTPMIWSANISDQLAEIMKSGPVKA
jgi:hypothetical protein